MASASPLTERFLEKKGIGVSEIIKVRLDTLTSSALDDRQVAIISEEQGS